MEFKIGKDETELTQHLLEDFSAVFFLSSFLNYKHVLLLYTHKQVNKQTSRCKVQPGTGRGMRKVFYFLGHLCAYRDGRTKYLKRKYFGSIENRVAGTHELSLVQLESLWFYYNNSPPLSYLPVWWLFGCLHTRMEDSRMFHSPLSCLQTYKYHDNSTLKPHLKQMSCF